MVSAEHLYTNRITVSAPWAHSGLLEIACELKVSNDLQLMRLAASEKLASKIQQRKDPAEDLKQMTHYRDTDDSLIEEGVTQAVADVLQGGVIILSSRYTFKGAAGDLDGLVAGRYKDQQVVVLAEAKHNMKTNWKKAMDEHFQANKHWKKLPSSVAEELEESDRAGYEAMQMYDLLASTIMLGFGGSKFE